MIPDKVCEGLEGLRACCPQLPVVLVLSIEIQDAYLAGLVLRKSL